MKAYVLRGINEFYIEEIDKPVLKEGEVLVKVMAAGICGSDIPRVYQTGAHVHPIVIGHEFSGKVVEVFDERDNGLLEKPVGVFPLIPCKKCVQCQKKQYEMCQNYSYLGSRRDGGFAEYVAVPRQCLIPLPGNVSYEAAAMLEPMAVSVHAMRNIGVSKDDCVVVCGLGTIGLLLVMFLKSMGVERVYVIGNKGFQRQKAYELGIKEEEYCDAKIENVSLWVDSKTGGGPDVFFECVGKNETVQWSVDSTRPGGKVMLIGNPHSDMDLPKPVYWKILRRQLTIKGTWNSSFTGEETDDWHYVLSLLSHAQISPEELISHRFSMEDLERGFKIMREKEEDYIKIMGVFE